MPSKVDLRMLAQRNFICAIEAHARRSPEKIAVACGDQKLTRSELDAFACGIARALSRQGVIAGDRVAIVLPNGFEFVAAFLGTLKVGATPAPLNPLLKPEELAAFQADLKPKLTIDRVALEKSSWSTKEDANCPSLILYTSGSTGRPKGAVFSHEALSFANRSWADPVMRLTEEDNVLAAVPLAHSLGLNGGLLAPLVTGAAVVILDRFTPEAVFAAIEQHRVTVFPAVATIFRRLLNSASLAQTKFASLSRVIAGAAPCPWELAVEWRERIGTRIVRGYGMTELFRPLSFRAADPAEIPQSVGRAVPGVETRIVVEPGASADNIGELWIRSPAMMSHYLDAPEETDEVISEGWFKTGDLASMDEHGYVQIAGRKRERILRGGYSVFPQEIESVLTSHPAVAEAAVIGIPDADLGEEVAAFVSLKPSLRTSSEELLDYCKEHLARYKYPRHLRILPELPKGPTGKILKPALLYRE